MTSLLWAVLATGAGLAAAAAALRLLVPPPPRHDSDLSPEGPVPRTPLQVRAWWALGIALAVAVGLGLVVATRGAESWDASAGTRFAVYGLVLGGFAALGLLAEDTRRRIARGTLVLDERDETLLRAAPMAQVAALLVSQGVWTVVLTEAWRSEGAVPVVFLTVLFWSSIVVCMIALPLGVLVAARRG